jgi:hypothetical protein
MLSIIKISHTNSLVNIEKNQLQKYHFLKAYDCLVCTTGHLFLVLIFWII